MRVATNRLIVAALLTSCIAASPAAEDVDPQTKRLRFYLDQCYIQKYKLIEFIKRTVSDQSDRDRRVADLMGNRYYATFAGLTLSVGDVGDQVSCEVIQVSGESSILGTIKWYLPAGNPANILTADATVWVSGVKTHGIVDGVTIRLPGPLEVIGTTSYVDVRGAKRTVFEVRPMPEAKKFIDAEWAAKLRHDADVAKKADEKRQADADAKAAEGVRRRAPAAKSLLELGKSLQSRGDKEAAKKRFQKVVDDYPETPSAKEARVLLDRP